MRRAYTKKTIMRLVQQYGPELDKRVRLHSKPTNDSWWIDETCVKVKGQWIIYLIFVMMWWSLGLHFTKTRKHFKFSLTAPSPYKLSNIKGL